MQTGFWLDELYTVYAADPTLPIAKLLRERILPDPHPFPYYMLMWVWHHLVGPGETASRLFGGLAGALALPLTARLLVGVLPAPAVAAGVSALALGWAGVYFAHEARSYALLYALSGIGYALVLRTLASGRTRRRVAALMLVAASAGALHFYGMVLGCALWLAQAAGHWQRGARPQARADIGWMVLLAAAFILLLMPQIPYLTTIAGDFWARNDLGALALGYAELLAPQVGAQLVLLLLVVLAVVSGRAHKAFAVPLLVGIGVSFAVPALISLHTPILVARYFIVTIPPLLLVITLSAVVNASRLRVAAVALALVVIGATSARAYLWETDEHWREAAALVAAITRPGCPVPVYIFGRELPPESYDYYLPVHLRGQVVQVKKGEAVPEPVAGCSLVLWYGHPGKLLPTPSAPVRVVNLRGQILWLAQPGRQAPPSARPAILPGPAPL